MSILKNPSAMGSEKSVSNEVLDGRLRRPPSWLDNHMRGSARNQVLQENGSLVAVSSIGTGDDKAIRKRRRSGGGKRRKVPYPVPVSPSSQSSASPDDAPPGTHWSAPDEEPAIIYSHIRYPTTPPRSYPLSYANVASGKSSPQQQQQQQQRPIAAKKGVTGNANHTGGVAVGSGSSAPVHDIRVNAGDVPNSAPFAVGADRAARNAAMLVADNDIPNLIPPHAIHNNNDANNDAKRERIRVNDDNPVNDNDTREFVRQLFGTMPSFYRNLSHRNHGAFIHLCRMYFKAYSDSDDDDHAAKSNAIRDIFMIPRISLIRGYRGGHKVIGKSIQKAIVMAKSKKPHRPHAQSLDPRNIIDDIDRAAQSAAEREDRAFSRKVKRVVHLCHDGHANRALSVLTAGGIHSCTPKVLDTLSMQHPPPADGDDCEFPSIDIQKKVDISVAQLRKVLQSKRIDNGAAAGCSGWTVELLQIIMSDDVCAQGFTDLMNDIVNSRIDDHYARALLCAGRLIPGRKPNDGVRPIVVGEVMYRIAGHLVMKDIMDDKLMIEKLFPSHTQMGVGQPGGSNRAVHTIRSIFDDYAAIDDPIMVTVDFTNAFNMMSRQVMATTLCHNPLIGDHPINAFFHWAYGHTTPLMVYDGSNLAVTIDSTRGVRQGCFVGGFAFALNAQRAFDRVDEEGKINNGNNNNHIAPVYRPRDDGNHDDINGDIVDDACENGESKDESKSPRHDGTYAVPIPVPNYDDNDGGSQISSSLRGYCIGLMDDVTLIGPPHRVFAMYDILIEQCKAPDTLTGMEVNPIKCQLLWRHDRDPPRTIVHAANERHIPIHQTRNGHGVVVLGGPRHYVAEKSPYWRSKIMKSMAQWALDYVEKHDELFRALCHSQMPMQVAYQLLRTCVNNRLMYFMGTHPPSWITEALQIWQSHVHDVLINKFNFTSREIDRQPRGVNPPHPAAHLVWSSSRDGGIGFRSVDIQDAHRSWLCSSLYASPHIAPFIQIRNIHSHYYRAVHVSHGTIQLCVNSAPSFINPKNKDKEEEDEKEADRFITKSMLTRAQARKLLTMPFDAMFAKFESKHRPHGFQRHTHYYMNSASLNEWLARHKRGSAVYERWADTKQRQTASLLSLDLRVIEYRMSDHIFIAWLRHRVGLSPFRDAPSSFKCPACGSEYGNEPDHHWTCAIGYSSERTAVHHGIARTIGTLSTIANVPHYREPVLRQIITRRRNTDIAIHKDIPLAPAINEVLAAVGDKRPDGHIITDDDSLLYDVKVACVTAETYLKHYAIHRDEGYHITWNESEKDGIYKALIKQMSNALGDRFIFRPFIISAHGVMGKWAKFLIIDIANQAVKNGIPCMQAKGSHYAHYLTLIQLALARGVSIMYRSCIRMYNTVKASHYHDPQRGRTDYGTRNDDVYCDDSDYDPVATKRDENAPRAKRTSQAAKRNDRIHRAMRAAKIRSSRSSAQRVDKPRDIIASQPMSLSSSVSSLSSSSSVAPVVPERESKRAAAPAVASSSSSSSSSLSSSSSDHASHDSPRIADQSPNASVSVGNIGTHIANNVPPSLSSFTPLPASLPSPSLSLSSSIAAAPSSSLPQPLSANDDTTTSATSPPSSTAPSSSIASDSPLLVLSLPSSLSQHDDPPISNSMPNDSSLEAASNLASNAPGGNS